MQNFRKYNNNHGRNGNNPGGYGKKNFRRNFRSIKKLDANLFIKKAIDSNVSQVENSTTVLFTDYNISDKLKRNIEEHGYKNPTPIQERAIPEILKGKDIIGMANTGTGKTAAFLITLINKVTLNRNQRALIVVPTRELAVQISDEFKLFARGLDVEAVAAIGGENIKRQMYSLKHNPHFVIGTPGRIKDLIQRKVLNLMLFQNVVLDEVDRMVDIGFLKDIEFIISYLPRVRQSLFFSATVDGKTEGLLKKFVNNPITVYVKKQNTAENIEQDIIRVSDQREKLDILHDLLVKPGFDKVLIFGRTKWGMEKLSKALLERGFKAAAIHGNKSQSQRQRALTDFKESRLQILIATDVASRGLDIEEVTHVINYDAPESYEDYVHRIGRTGRAGKSGIALTFVE